jgi:hypothetical protein
LDYCDYWWSQQINLTQFVLNLPEVLHLDQTLFNKGLKAAIDHAKPIAHILDQRSLTNLGRLMQPKHDFELDLLSVTS